MSKSDELNISSRLIQACVDLEKSLTTFNGINQKAHFIAMSAAIEGARMRNRLGTFSIVANQIASQASKNNQLSEKLEDLIVRIKRESLDAIAIRNFELSTDLMDKLDRNLFERNCDVQAWAGFDEVKKALTEVNEQNSAKAAEILEQLTKIYVVYCESLLLDETGNIVVAASRKDLVEKNLGQEEWFLEALAGQVVVTDLHYSETISKRSVFYCAPVSNSEGKVVGVLCNCFDWAFAEEMIQSAGFSDETRAAIVNVDGEVICSTNRHEILNDHMNWLEAGQLAISEKSGFSTEKARNGRPIAVGFTHTKGYNSYKGKHWSAVVWEILRDIRLSASSTVYDSKKETVNNQIRIASEVSSLKLVETMQEIDSLVFEINSNNREVKLLAVNASIQAGLAGEEGEGFSIVANEVALLAKKSLSFVEEVNKITSLLGDAVEQASSLRIVDASRDTVNKVDRNLFERYCDIQAWAIFGTLVNVCEQNKGNDQGAIELLKKIHKIYEVYHDIYILSKDGKILASAINSSIIGQNFALKDWFKAALTGNIFVSDIYSSDTQKMALMTFSAPILSANREIVGVIASRFNCSFLNDIIKATIIDSNSTCLLVNHSGKVIASASQEDVLKKTVPETESLTKEYSNNIRFLENKIQETNEIKGFGFEFSKGYNTYKGQQWLALVERPRRQVTSENEVDPAERFKQVVQQRKKSA